MSSNKRKYLDYGSADNSFFLRQKKNYSPSPDLDHDMIMECFSMIGTQEPYYCIIGQNALRSFRTVQHSGISNIIGQKGIFAILVVLSAQFWSDEIDSNRLVINLSNMLTRTCTETRILMMDVFRLLDWQVNTFI